MKSLMNTIKYDYLQRTRTYPFLITLCASLTIAYTFVPEPNANYSTIRIADHIGYYNSAWFGYVTAIMTSIFLSLIGFYLINSGIKKDVDTKVGQIVAATQVSNFKYLLSKVLSNFLLLLTIVVIVFMMAIILFFLNNDGFPFELSQFITPYVIITIPAMFCVAVIAVLFEVIFGKSTVLLNVVFFFVFTTLMVVSPKTEQGFALDIFGNKIVIHQMEEQVRSLINIDESTKMTVGYVLGNIKESTKFLFNGIQFPKSFIISRILWILLATGCIFVTSFFFNRFNIKEVTTVKKSAVKISSNFKSDILYTLLPIATINFNIFPLLKTELILLLRKGSRWLWIITTIGFILLMVLPLQIAHQIVLPILWFLQVGSISELATKEINSNIHYLSFSSFYPLRRLLVSQLLASSILMISLSTPLLLRYAVTGNSTVIISIILGGVFIVLSAAILEIISKGKKLFEVLFFMLTYMNINKIPFADYFGGLYSTTEYVLKLYITCIVLTLIIFTLKNLQLKRQ